MIKAPHLFVDGERPGLEVYWADSVDAPIDVSGYALSLTFEQAGVETTVQASLTAHANPTANTGSAGDVPSVTIAFGADTLASIVPGPLTLRLIAELDGRRRVFESDLVVDR